MAGAVYLLCTATSLACAVLLLRGYRASGARLLYWSGLCFIGLTLNNGLLFVDVEMLPQTDLSLVRSLPTLIGLVLLVYGLICDTE